MHRVEPKIHLIAATEMSEGGVVDYLEDIGAVGWDSDAPDGVNEVIEVMGRSCYMSFPAEEGYVNPNISRIRDGYEPYIKNILKVNHGSVLEHSWVSFMFTHVSRVFTHELVRHRVGTAISQESLRYVRLEDLGLWIPSCYADDAAAELVFYNAFENAETSYRALLEVAARIEGVATFDDIKSFDKKKVYTSAARRVAPIGLATAIGWSCNMRTLRHVIQMRTDEHAEEEIRVVFKMVEAFCREKWPVLFEDV